MNAGLPGIGISGIFYLFTALVLPFIEIVQTLRGRSTLARWKFVVTHFGFFWGIMCGFWVTGYAVSRGLALFHHTVATAMPAALRGNFFQIKPLFLSLITLAAVLSMLWLSNLYLDWKAEKRVDEAGTEDVEAVA
jgi:hypothetical protein